MVVPVALKARALMLCEPVVLALTTAGVVVRRSGLKTIGFKDLVVSEDLPWLERGRQLIDTIDDPAIDREESAAYLGLSMMALTTQHGSEHANTLYTKFGRQIFLPVGVLERAIKSVKADLVCATNSPRAERAAIIAAGNLGIPSLCMVDLFAVDERDWIGRKSFADKVCVLNEGVRQTLLRMDRQHDEVVVTGNPAFDRLFDPEQMHAATQMRSKLGGGKLKILVWASHAEPSIHPWRNQKGDPNLSDRVLKILIDYVTATDEWILAIRPHPNESPPVLPTNEKIILTGQDWPLAPLLHACDAVCTMTSTVGLEAHLIGKQVIQISGSIFDDAVPYVQMGVAIPASIETLPQAINSLTGRQNGGGTFNTPQKEEAASRVVVELQSLMNSYKNRLKVV